MMFKNSRCILFHLKSIQQARSTQFLNIVLKIFFLLFIFYIPCFSQEIPSFHPHELLVRMKGSASLARLANIVPASVFTLSSIPIIRIQSLEIFPKDFSLLENSPTNSHVFLITLDPNATLSDVIATLKNNPDILHQETFL